MASSRDVYPKTQRISRSVWTASGLPALSNGLGVRKAGASSAQSKRFATSRLPELQGRTHLIARREIAQVRRIGRMGQKFFNLRNGLLDSRANR
jgi:hypothetical protein